jgi:hypothetical protein
MYRHEQQQSGMRRFHQQVETGCVCGKGQPTGVVCELCGGWGAIEYWNNPEFDEKLWNACIPRRIPEPGLRPDQIRVVWHKAASIYTIDENRNVLSLYPDPDSDTFNFYNLLTIFAGRVAEKLPRKLHCAGARARLHRRTKRADIGWNLVYIFGKAI